MKNVYNWSLCWEIIWFCLSCRQNDKSYAQKRFLSEDIYFASWTSRTLSALCPLFVRSCPLSVRSLRLRGQSSHFILCLRRCSLSALCPLSVRSCPLSVRSCPLSGRPQSPFICENHICVSYVLWFLGYWLQNHTFLKNFRLFDRDWFVYVAISQVQQGLSGVSVFFCVASIVSRRSAIYWCPCVTGARLLHTWKGILHIVYQMLFSCTLVARPSLKFV